MPRDSNMPTTTTDLDLDINQELDYDDTQPDTGPIQAGDITQRLTGALREAYSLAEQSRRDLVAVRLLLRKMIAEDDRQGVYYHKMTPKVYNQIKQEAYRQ